MTTVAATSLTSGRVSDPLWRPYIWRDPAASTSRRQLAALITATIGPETDAFDLPWPVTRRRLAPGQLKPCGTQAAYARHRRHGEQPCSACADAHRQHVSYLRNNAGGRGRPDRLSALAELTLHDVRGDTTARPGALTAAQAAERLGVSVRTVERYKRQLREVS